MRSSMVVLSDTVLEGERRKEAGFITFAQPGG